MKSILGFGIGETPASENVTVTPKEELHPVRSLVSVRFLQDGRTLTYYNDSFALAVGDRVFVSGKLAGQPGIVEKVTTRFKINLADYQRVISKANTEIHGTYEAVLDKMVSYDRTAMSPENFRSWILPPAHWDGDGSGEESDEIIIGDGYELDISDLEKNEDVSAAVLGRAVDYCCSGKVAYISVQNSIGTAYIEGSDWYEVNFRLQGEMMSEMYCDCPYPGLCKHLLAVAMTVRALVSQGNLDPDADFVAIGEDRFWNMAAETARKVTL